MRVNRIFSALVVLVGLFSSACFQHDGWLDEPRAPEKDSLVVEEMDTTQEFREEGRTDIQIVPVKKQSKMCLDRRQRSFSTSLFSKFTCYRQKIRSEDPPEDLRIAFASFTV